MIPSVTDGKSQTEKNSIFILPKNFNCYICLTFRNPRQTTFHASPISYTSNVDTFLLEIDKLHIVKNWSKILNKLEWNTCEKHSPYRYKMLVKKGISHTFQDCNFTNLKPNLRLRILNSHLKLVIFIQNVRDIYIRLFCCHFSLKTLNASSWNKWVRMSIKNFTVRFHNMKKCHTSHYMLIYLYFEKMESCVESREQIPE